MTARPLMVAAVVLAAATSLGCTASRTRCSPREAAPTGNAADPWNAPLREALAGCDSLEIHDGTPHVVSVDGTAQVAEVVDLIELEPKRSGQAFCCTGNRTFTFARRGTHVASLASLYGLGWRWQGGPWEADAVPTTTSSLALARWLTAHGSPVDLEEQRRSLEEQQRRIDRERTKERVAREGG